MAMLLFAGCKWDTRLRGAWLARIVRKAVAPLAMASLNTTVGLTNDITRCSAPPCATWRFSLGRCLGSCAGRNNGNRCCRRRDLDLQGAACCSYAYFSLTACLSLLRHVEIIKFDIAVSRFSIQGTVTGC